MIANGKYALSDSYLSEFSKGAVNVLNKPTHTNQTHSTCDLLQAFHVHIADGSNIIGKQIQLSDLGIKTLNGFVLSATGYLCIA